MFARDFDLAIVVEKMVVDAAPPVAQATIYDVVKALSALLRLVLLLSAAPAATGPRVKRARQQ